MKKICNVILTLLIIGAIIVLGLIFIKYWNNHKNEERLIAVIDQMEEQFKENSEQGNSEPIEIQIEGYNVEGIIEIPKINIKYPIIDQTSDQAMKVSITKFWGDKVNGVGNYTMAGHNNKDGTMFGKTKFLEIGDIIKMTDLYQNTIEYKIFKIYTIDPDDVTCVNSVENGTKEITLITCTNGHKNRLIVKAREIK